MVQFIQPIDQTDKNKIDNFINIFNGKIIKHDFKIPLCLNDVLDKLPFLSEKEFEVVSKRALTANFKIESFNDNYNTTSYKIYKINN